MLLLAGAFGAALFVAVFLIDGATRPGYDPARLPVSALSLGERGWVQIGNFIVTGLLMGACALGLRRALPDVPGATWGPLLLAAFAVGLIAAGAFVMDPPDGYPPNPAPVTAAGQSRQGIAHDLASLVVFTALPAAAFVLARAFWGVRGLRRLAEISIAAGLLCAALLIVFVIADESGSAIAGVWQRATIITGWTWIAVMAVIVATTVREDVR
ncbi:DUF998 domain-containing protein [Jiangella ureilytica]|uniref:DUF998 domain-containing protein n=2 Tax=Jiangella ureilytica TaxID=2530374 RepID=A0A4R4RCT5_9ACTN|nr:DUF998 domain-containing protein [Jiangella ureilytica]